MAKKVTIEGSNKLSQLSDDWGGKNEGNSDITKYGTSVPAGAEWGMNRGEVERFIKEQFGMKFGDFRTTAPDSNSFIHILCFASPADASAYDDDPVGNEDRILKDLTIPISTASVDSYIASLATNRQTSTQYLVKDGGSFIVPLRFNATHIIAATSTQELMSGNGTLIIERSPNGRTWTQVKTMTIAASSENAGYPVEVELKGLLIEGVENYVRLRVSFSYTDNEGAAQTIGSTPIILNINSVTLSLEMATPWHEPQVDPSNLSLAYTVRGTVTRTLHLSVTGSEGTFTTTRTLAASQTSESFSLIEQAAYGLLTHGIKTCEAWLTAGNATVGELESEHLIVRIMVVRSNSEYAMQPMVLISEMKEQVENFVQTRLLGYAIYSPTLNNDGEIVNSGSPIPMTFILTNSASSILSYQQNVFASMHVNPSPGQKYYLDMTVEIEQEGDSLSSFLHVTRDDNGTTRDFLMDSTGSGSLYLVVDNTGGFQPTAGSTFLLNPKQRNNEEANPMTILNAKANNAAVQSTWTNFRLGNEDGYLKDEDGESCLRIPAGRVLNIAYNPLALLYRSPNASLNMEFDVCIRNVTNEDDTILQLAEQVSGVWRGLRLLPMTGFMTTESWNANEESDFRWQEDVRTHIAINIVNAVYPNAHGDALTTAEKASQAQGSFPLVRVFINGIINREFVYTPSSSEFCTGALSNGGITIGQNGADIDIYGIRIWEGVALTPEQVLQDYISTLPSSDKKRRLKDLNNIIDPNTGLIGLDYITGEGSVEGIKKNVLIWHGNEPYHENAHKGETGWLEMRRYDSEGNYLPELSGKICEATKSIPQKAQGTTAKTYYYHNIQVSIKDAAGTITIAPSDLHSSISATWNADYVWKDGDNNPTGETGAWMIKGGYLGKNFPLATESAQPYHGTESSIEVPDGWIDGNGKYRGQGYQVAEGIPMAQKLVNKINYASSMQSHLIGINWLYNELHTAIVGKNKMQQDVQGAVVAKHTEPFLFFTQAEGSTRAVFRGPCAWGAGKMDKPSWGYVKSAHPDFCMIEGADNDKQLTDMRVPWDDEAHGSSPAKVFYDPEEEAFYYRLAGGGTEKCLDFDGGKTDDAGYPSSSIIGYIKAAWNFLYLHAPRIRHYNGTLSEFLVDADWAQRSITSETTQADRQRIELARSRVNTANKYWCHTEGSTATGDYLLKRYDYTDGEWVDAGLWDGMQYAQIDLRTYGMTAAAWNALTEAQKNQSELANKAFVDAIVADARANIGSYFNVSSLKFHYCFQNHFIAGTDNCSKNTYYVLDPVTHLFELHQDDVDTTLATDNSGLQSKPYYIDRMHPYAGVNASRVAMTGDVDNDNILYEGYYNVLFDLVELMYEPTGDLQNMMNTILSEIASLSGGNRTEESNAMSGVWRSLNRYIFDIQRYFPATVYNEAARIRYELPELIGFLSDIRSIHPIKQSMGDQLEAELQFMKRRLVYMASYAAFGEFTPTSLRSGLTGLSEATESFGMQKFALPGSSSPSAYTFQLVPHQWIYPTGGRETSNLIDPHVRVAPGEAFTLDINPGQASDLGVNVFGLNYYRELGNVGDMVANNGQANFTLNGRRLTKFICEPTVFYTGEQLPAFRVNNIIIGTATRLKEFNVKGAVIGTGTLNLSALTLAETIDLRDTGISQVRLPETSKLQSLQLPASLSAVSLTAQPGLSTLTLQGYANLTQLTIRNCPSLASSTRTYIEGLITTGAIVTYIDINNIDWQAHTISTDTLRWLLDVGDRGTCRLAGRITMASTSASPSGRLYYDDVARLIRRYGNIYDSTITVGGDGLYVNFAATSVTAAMMSIGGNKYINPSELLNPTRVNGSITSGYHDDLSLVVSGAGNNVAAVRKTDGTWTPDVEWSIQTSGMSSYAVIEDIYSPRIHVLQISQVTMTVRVTLTDINGNKRYAEKTIGLWRRVPQVGDFAWTDGEFDNENDQSKVLAGIVVMRQMFTSGGVLTKKPAECSYYKVWVLSYCGGTNTSALNVTMVASSDGKSSSVGGVGTQCWGLYPDTSEANGISDAKSNNVYVNALLAKIALDTEKSDVFDTPLSNLSGDIYLRKNAEAVTAEGSGVAMQDENLIPGEGEEVTGWANVTQSYLTNFDSESERDTLLAYADTVLQSVLEYFGISDSDLPANCKDEEGHTHPRTPQALADLTQLVVMYCIRDWLCTTFSEEQTYEVGAHVVYNGGRYTCIEAVTTAGEWAASKWEAFGIDDINLSSPEVTAISPGRFRELMFPAQRLCNVWCPADVASNNIPESDLDDQYKRGKWMLPSSALLARIFNFYGNSRASYNASSAAAAEYADETPLEAMLPVFSNAIKRGRTVPMSYSSYHWSSTELSRNTARLVNFYYGLAIGPYKSGSLVVRPVAAFTFVP